MAEMWRNGKPMNAIDRISEDQNHIARVLELLGEAERTAEMIHWRQHREIITRNIQRVKDICYRRQSAVQ